MKRAFRVGLTAVSAVALSPGLALAQGSLSVQGLGYPQGQLSTAALSMGGALGEADGVSALNPASIGWLREAIVLMQAEPEYRRMRLADDQLERTSVARFPLFLGALRLGSRWTVSLSASTLLDRTWGTTARDSQIVGIDTIITVISQTSDGSITDVRAALSFATTNWWRLGIAAHGLTGRDFLQTVRAFPDSVRFARDTQQTTVGFGGNAVSAGAQAMWPRVGTIGVMYRRGGSLRTSAGDSTVATASAPDHFGVSFAYLGIEGSTIAIRAARDLWSRLEGLSPTLNIHEGWDLGVGADIAGPRVVGATFALRAGARWRTLPFSADAAAVRERSISGGFGLPIARGRAELNIGAVRATRTAIGLPTETAWTVSTGFAVRP